jgi:N-acetylneuraminic acid mutarotase
VLFRSYDSNNNSNDFILRATSSPQRSISPTEPSPWIAKTSMPIASTHHSSGVINGKIYVAGGNNGGVSTATSTLLAYDPATDIWETKTNMPTARWGSTAAVVDNKLFVVSGSVSPIGMGQGSTKNEAYDPSTNQWTTQADLPNANPSNNAGWGMAADVLNGKLYAVGGYNWSAQGMNKTREYESNNWTFKTNMPTSRSWLGAKFIDGKLYAVGGYNWDNTVKLATLEVYDPATNTWTAKQSMPMGLTGVATAVFGGKLYVMGGYTGAYYGRVYSYDPSLNTWQRLDDLPAAIAEATAEATADGIYLIGGVTTGGAAVNSVFYWKP